MKGYHEFGNETCLAVRVLLSRVDLVGKLIIVVELVQKTLIRIAHDVMVKGRSVADELMSEFAGVAHVMALAELVKETPIVLATRPSKYDERSLWEDMRHGLVSRREICAKGVSERCYVLLSLKLVYHSHSHPLSRRVLRRSSLP